MPKCFRKPDITGPHVYYARLDDDSVFAVAGEDAKFDWSEAMLIEGGREPADILARRAKLAAKVSAKAEASEESGEPETFKPRGRPRKEG